MYRLNNKQVEKQEIEIQKVSILQMYRLNLNLIEVMIIQPCFNTPNVSVKWENIDKLYP